MQVLAAMLISKSDLVILFFLNKARFNIKGLLYVLFCAIVSFTVVHLIIACIFDCEDERRLKAET